MPSRLRGVDGGPVSPQDLEDRVFTQVSHGHEDDDDDGDDDDGDDDDGNHDIDVDPAAEHKRQESKGRPGEDRDEGG